MIKTFKLYKIVTGVLSIFFAIHFIVDFVQIHLQLFGRDIDLHLIGFQRYFLIWQNNADTLALSFTVISLFYIFKQIELSNIQNHVPLFEIWKTKHQTPLNDLVSYNIIYNTVDSHLFSMYYNLMGINKDYRINNKKQLLRVLGPILTKENIKEFEESVIIRNNIQANPSAITSHSFPIVEGFVLRVFNPSSSYRHQFSIDLREIYKKYI